jgi:hypothetical protein
MHFLGEEVFYAMEFHSDLACGHFEIVSGTINQIVTIEDRNGTRQRFAVTRYDDDRLPFCAVIENTELFATREMAERCLSKIVDDPVFQKEHSETEWFGQTRGRLLLNWMKKARLEEENDAVHD